MMRLRWQTWTQVALGFQMLLTEWHSSVARTELAWLLVPGTPRHREGLDILAARITGFTVAWGSCALAGAIGVVLVVSALVTRSRVPLRMRLGWVVVAAFVTTALGYGAANWDRARPW